MCKLLKILTDRNLLLEHHCYSYKNISIIIYYNHCSTPKDDIPFFDIQCTSLLVAYWSVSSESNFRGWYPNFHSGSLALPWDAKKTYITFMNLSTCFWEQIQFALNKKLEHCKLQQCVQSQSKGHPGCLVVHIQCNHTTAYEFSFQKKIRVCQDKYWCPCKLTKSECAVPEDIHTQHSFMASLKKFIIFQNSKVSGRESSNREKNLHVGYESSLEENNVWEIINYKIMFKKYLTW